MVKVDGSELTWLLGVTQRKQNVSGKAHAQVTSCMLDCVPGEMSTTTLVKDGLTSLSDFTIGCEGKEGWTSVDYPRIPVADIDTLLGALKYHGNTVTLTYDKKTEKLLIKSAKKQTTLSTSAKALAYTNARDTIEAWFKKSTDLAAKFTKDGYVTNDLDILEPAHTYVVDAVDLFEALRCDAMNGQKLNRYTFLMKKEGLDVVVGGEMKGLTSTTLIEDDSEAELEWAFEGGLDNVLVGLKGDVVLDFYDFREHNQGGRMGMWLNDCTSWVYQAGVLKY